MSYNFKSSSCGKYRIFRGCPSVEVICSYYKSSSSDFISSGKYFTELFSVILYRGYGSGMLSDISEFELSCRTKNRVVWIYPEKFGEYKEKGRKLFRDNYERDIMQDVWLNE